MPPAAGERFLIVWTGSPASPAGHVLSRPSFIAVYLNDVLQDLKLTSQRKCLAGILFWGKVLVTMDII